MPPRRLSLLGIAIFAIAVFMSVVGIGRQPHASQWGRSQDARWHAANDPDPAHRPTLRGHRRSRLPRAPSALPNLFYWPRARHIPILPAIGTYLLVFPWVLLVSIAVENVAKSLDPAAAKEKHVIFTVWQGEQDGMTIFKLVAICSAVIVAPIAEEILFRGVLQRMLQRLTRRPIFAVLMTSLAFALIHEPWTLWPGVFLLSVFLGQAYFRTGNLLVPILAHAIFNGLQLVLFMLLPSSN